MTRCVRIRWARWAAEFALIVGSVYLGGITYNSAHFDESLSAASQSWTAVRWQSLDSAPLSRDEAGLQQLASSLEFIHVAWNLWYRDLLIEHRDDVVAMISMVEDYLTTQGLRVETP